MDEIQIVVQKIETKKPLSSAEQSLAISRIDDVLAVNSVYSWVIAMGKSVRKDQSPLLEALLMNEGDAWVAKGALLALCMFDRNRYRDVIEKFLAGVAWDEDEDCKLTAILEAGELVRNQCDPKLLSQLVDIVNSPSELESIRVAVIRALGRALGMDWRQLRLGEEIDPNDGWSEKIKRAAKERLQ